MMICVPAVVSLNLSAMHHVFCWTSCLGGNNVPNRPSDFVRSLKTNTLSNAGASTQLWCSNLELMPDLIF